MTGLILLLCLVSAVIAVIAFDKNRFGVFTIMMIICAGSVVGGIAVGSSYISQKGFPAEYNAIKLTIKNTKVDDSYIERAALIHKIIDINRYIASAKYWNSCAYGIFDWAYPDEIIKLQMLKTTYE